MRLKLSPEGELGQDNNFQSLVKLGQGNVTLPEPSAEEEVSEEDTPVNSEEGEPQGNATPVEDPTKETPVDYKKMYEELLAKQESPKEPEKPEIETPSPFTLANLTFDDLPDEEVQKFGVDAGATREMLSKVADRMTKNVLAQLPQAISHIVATEQAARAAVTKFYEKYPELKGNEPLVVAITQGIEAKNPGISMQQLFEKAGEESKRILAASKGSPTKSHTKKVATNPPTHPGGKPPVNNPKALAAKDSNFAALLQGGAQ